MCFCLMAGLISLKVRMTVVRNCFLSSVWGSVMEMSHQGLSFLESSPSLLPEKMNETDGYWKRVDLQIAASTNEQSSLCCIFGC